MGARKQVWSPLPKAADGETWVLAWNVPAVREIVDDFGNTALHANERTSLIKCVQGNYSPVGLGTVEIEMVEIHGRLDGGKLAGALSGTTHLGSASFIGNGSRLSVPDKATVLEATQIEQTLQALAGVKVSNRINMSKHVKQIASLDYSIVLPNSGAASDSDDYPYGLAFVPKVMCDGLIIIDRKHILNESHNLCDLLGTKHNIMNQFGFTDAIILDNRLINNRSEYEIAQRDKGLLSALGGRY